MAQDRYCSGKRSETKFNATARPNHLFSVYALVVLFSSSLTRASQQRHFKTLTCVKHRPIGLYRATSKPRSIIWSPRRRHGAWTHVPGRLDDWARCDLATGRVDVHSGTARTYVQNLSLCNWSTSIKDAPRRDGKWGKHGSRPWLSEKPREIVSPFIILCAGGRKGRTPNTW